jgi:hypothetical protein
MMDLVPAFPYFGLPTTVGLIGLAAMKLHERSAPPLQLSGGSSRSMGSDVMEIEAHGPVTATIHCGDTLPETVRLSPGTVVPLKTEITSGK